MTPAEIRSKREMRRGWQTSRILAEKEEALEDLRRYLARLRRTPEYQDRQKALRRWDRKRRGLRVVE